MKLIMILQLFVIFYIFESVVSDSGENILLNKPVLLSFDQSIAAMLTDGDLVSYIWTNQKIFDYAVIDMKGVYKVNKVKTYNRFYWTKQKFSLYITDSFRQCYLREDFKKLKPCYIDAVGGEPETEFECVNGGAEGRYLVLVIGKMDATEVSHSMDLQEIQAFGELKKTVPDIKYDEFDNTEFSAATYKDFPLTSSIVKDNVKTLIPNYASGVQSGMKNCQPLIWSTDKKKTFAQVCTGLKKARMAIFGKAGYYDSYLGSGEYTEITKPLDNWLSGSETPTKIDLSSANDLDQLKSKLGKNNIFVLNPGSDINIDYLNGALDLVNDGKAGLVVHYHLWNTPTENQVNNMKRIWKEYGVSVYYFYITWSSQTIVTLKYSDLYDDYLSLDTKLIKAVESHNYLIQNMKSIVEYMKSLPGDLLDSDKLLPIFKKILKKYGDFLEHFQPCIDNGLGGDKNRNLLEFLGEIGLSQIMADSGYILPGVQIFPGVLKESVKKSKHTIKLNGFADSAANPIGLYLNAGDTLKYTVKSIKGNWQLRIGCHTDTIPYSRDTWSRYPRIYTDVNVDSKSGKAYSAFGGVLFLLNNKADDSIEIEFENVVRSPYFNLRDPNAASKWDNGEKDLPGLWAQIAGDNLIICEESSLVKQFDGKYLTDLMGNIWDKLVKMDYAIKGIDWRSDRNQMVVLDQQTSAGWGHSGYPLEVHRPWHSGIFNINEIKLNGSWGMCHEIGHNMQSGKWTFSGTGEVTNNNFCLYNYDKLFKLGRYGSSADKVESYVPPYLNKPDFSVWKDYPFLALMTYAQIANHMGWGMYHKVFVYYEENKIEPTDDDDKIAQWINITSIVSGQNLVPLFDYWGFPINAQVSNELSSKFNCFLPQDFFADFAKDRFNEIKNKYKNCHSKSTFYEDFDFESKIVGRRSNNIEIN